MQEVTYQQCWLQPKTANSYHTYCKSAAHHHGETHSTHALRGATLSATFNFWAVRLPRMSTEILLQCKMVHYLPISVSLYLLPFTLYIAYLQAPPIALWYSAPVSSPVVRIYGNSSQLPFTLPNLFTCIATNATAVGCRYAHIALTAANLN